MLKNLKSKFLLGVMVIAIMFVGAFALTQKASAAPQAIVTVADIQYAATVKLGSSGQASLIWQNFLNGYSITANLVADGKFGPLSSVQAKAWQASRGLVADGVLGAMSRASAIAQITSGIPASTFPAGCTSTVGYSSVNGLPCAGVSYPAGCSAGTAFSSTTGLSCTAVVTTLPAGCSSTAGFSSTTGAKCDGGSVSTNTGPLAGGAGSITVTKTTTDIVDPVTEGAVNAKVLGFKVEASDSDVAVTNLKVTLTNSDTSGSSTRLDRYASTVSVYMNGTKVGSADVADFTKDGIIYTKSIALSNAIVRMGTSNKQTFYITLTANSSIDSTNMGSTKADWAILVDNIRFQDATGVVMTSNEWAGNTQLGAGSTVSNDSTDLTNFHFDTLANSSDVKVTVSKGSSSPLPQNVEIKTTGSTSDVLMNEFKIKATGVDASFDSISVTPTSTETTGDITDVVGELQLRHGSDVLATIDGSALATGVSVAFNLDSTYTVSADSTDTFRIYATINGSNNFGGASSLKVSYTDNTNAFAPEDLNGDAISPTGSAAGEVQTFVTAGPQVAFVSSTYLAANDIDNVDGTIAMKFTVTALGDTDVVLKETQPVTTVTDGSASHAAATGVVVFTLTGANSNGARISSTTVTKDGSDNFIVSAGSTETFTLSVKTKYDTTSGFVTLAINNVDNHVVANTVQTQPY